MASSAQDMYLESRILSADGVELVRILYRAALESVEKARRHLEEGDIAARSREITRAAAVIAELAVSLDYDAGGALSRNLIELYDYMQRRLLEANFYQSEPILAEVSRLLATLLEGWMSCEPNVRQWPEAPIAEPEPEYAGLVAVNF
jgi:flagellar protein FliS